MSDTVVIYKDNTGQPLDDQIVVGNRAFNIPLGATVSFKMRNADSDVLKVDAAADIISEAEGKVRYQWDAADVDTPGEYYGWWEIDATSNFVETPEFLVIVSAHRPGFRTQTGAIYTSARSFMPITWDRLEDAPEYGDAQLQNKIEVAKLSLLGTEIDVEDEGNLDIRVISYIAKIAVISVIPAGKDYWAAMSVTKSVKGPDEQVSYPNRIEMLESLHEQLQAEIAADRDLISSIIDTPSVRPNNNLPDVSDGTDEGYITPNPHLNFRDYGFPVRGNTYGRRNAVNNNPYSRW